MAMRKGIRQWGQALPFVAPALILLCMFVLYPLARNIQISFSTNKGDTICTFTDISANRQYNLTFRPDEKHDTVNCLIMFTCLPIIQLQGTFDTEYNDGLLIFGDTINAHIKYRGSSTNAPTKTEF